MSVFPDEPFDDDEPGGAAPGTPPGVPDADEQDEHGVAEGEPAPLDPDDTEH